MGKENGDTSKRTSDPHEPFMKKLKMYEEDRVKSFNVWPFTNSENCAVKNVILLLNHHKIQMKFK